MVPGEYLSSRPVLDELGYLPIDKRGSDSLFQVVAARYEVGSIAITTNRPLREWGKLFDVDNTLATALIDRLMHRGEALVIHGDSCRMKDKGPDSTDEGLKRGTSTFGSGVRCEASWFWREWRGSSSPPSSKPRHRAGSFERLVP